MRGRVRGRGGMGAHLLRQMMRAAGLPCGCCWTGRFPVADIFGAWRPVEAEEEPAADKGGDGGGTGDGDGDGDGEALAALGSPRAAPFFFLAILKKVGVEIGYYEGIGGQWRKGLVGGSPGNKMLGGLGLGFGGLETRDLGMRVYDMDDAAGKRNAEIIRGWIRSTKICFLKIDPASSSGCRRRGRGRGTGCGGVRLEAPSSTIDKSIWRRRFVCSCKLQLCHALKSILAPVEIGEILQVTCLAPNPPMPSAVSVLGQDS